MTSPPPPCSISLSFSISWMIFVPLTMCNAEVPMAYLLFQLSYRTSGFSLLIFLFAFLSCKTQKNFYLGGNYISFLFPFSYFFKNCKNIFLIKKSLIFCSFDVNVNQC